MNNFLSATAKTDRFANRAKHREWDDGDLEAVWQKAIGELESEGTFDPPNRLVVERCIRILENPE